VTSSEILFEVRGRLGLVTLNRPKALNALTFEMTRVLDPQLRRWAEDPAIAAVAIRGAGDRAFCAGGDIRHLYELGIAGKAAEAVAFWREEYALNVLIKEYPKPYVAMIDGIVMGGGVGLSILGSHRVASEKINFAMPEVGIGFYPDVGATWFLPRLPQRAGYWLGLTGARIGVSDTLKLGLATHHVPSARFDAVIDALGRTGDVESVLAKESVDAGAAPVAANLSVIDRLFAGPSVAAIFDALDREAAGGPAAAFAAETARTMRTKSPTSLRIAFEQLRRGASLSFRDAMRVEFRLASRIFDGADFVEGIRAVVVDKDNAPVWRPATLAGVSDAVIDQYFASLGKDEFNP
jgi:enoyl-CoA hydratase